ncbi:MAG: hypothetical protein H0T42_18890 [Deltaproteobacteria bacterium]|nr:hypothetical protein [Deltaproteobacteria bacterium]
MRLAPIIWILLFAAACGGVAAEAPLTLKLGIPRDQATSQLRSHQYCHKSDGPPQKLETYPRCKRAGTEWGESWVTARFDGDTLVELRRWERFADDNAAIERWNQLVADRLKLGPDDPEALEALRARGPLAAGTRSVKAFHVDSTTIAAVYLLTPSPPEDASVLETIIRVK